MGIIQWVRGALSPAKVTGESIVRDRPLHEQVSRIGGGVTPEIVSSFLRYADAGQPTRLIDLFNESRQRDGHLQSACATRDQAVALLDIDFKLPKDATAEEKKAADTCRRAVDDFRNWSELIEHLTSAYITGHATAVLKPWARTKDGLLLPFEAKTVHPRDFIFTQDTGALRYRRTPGDIVGIDLLGEFPGMVVQLQRRIVGDAPVREGLMRVLVWAALFRNWDLRDWLALGELGWKPYLLAKYKAGTHQREIDKLVRVLENVLKNGYSVIEDTSSVDVNWPKGTGPSGQSPHRELFDVVGREISKAVLGQTSSIEEGKNGDRGGVKARDELRTDIRESDARAVAGALRYHFFAHIVALNHGANVRVPVPWFQTEEPADQKEFAEAMGILADHGLRVPVKWVRDEVGMPEPLEGEECLKPKALSAPKPAGGEDEEEDEDLDIPVTVEVDEEDGKGPKATKAYVLKLTKGQRAKLVRAAKRKADDDDLPSTGARDGLEYSDRLTDSGSAAGAKALASTVAAMVAEVAQAEGYEDALERIEKRYGTMLEPTELRTALDSAMSLAQLAGYAAVREDTPELED